MLTERIGLSGYKTCYKGQTTTGATHIESILKMFLLIELTS